MFADIPNHVHGIGLPEFMTPGPPPGQPLLSEHDTQNLDSFLNCFDNGGDQNKDGSMQSFQNNMNMGHEWTMPPVFVRSETSLRPPGAEWQNFQMAEFTFGNDMNLAGMNTSPEFHNGMHGYEFPNNNHQFDHNLFNQLHNVAQPAQPSYASGWQPGFQPQPASQIQQGPRPVMRFGSDSHFQSHGYVPPEGQFDQNTTPNLDWLEAQSSAANTQPNTEPNTQPSSPNWQKKRKLDDFQVDTRRNGFSPAMNGYSAVAQRTPPGSAIPGNPRALRGQEQPSLSRTQTHTSLKQEEEEVEDEDADYDDDEEPYSRTRSVSPSANTKAKSNKTSVKPARARKKSTASTTPGKSKSKLARNSTAGSTTSRVPLTADQKKANHTNSEQRRRDATARAYAELYDLVPELDEMGKQSTMKKLEVVVSKVQRVKERVRSLRAALGFDIETGAPLQHSGHHSHLGTGGARSMASTIHPELASWPR